MVTACCDLHNIKLESDSIDIEMTYDDDSGSSNMDDSSEIVNEQAKEKRGTVAKGFPLCRFLASLTRYSAEGLALEIDYHFLRTLSDVEFVPWKGGKMLGYVWKKTYKQST